MTDHQRIHAAAKQAKQPGPATAPRQPAVIQPFRTARTDTMEEQFADVDNIDWSAIDEATQAIVATPSTHNDPSLKPNNMSLFTETAGRIFELLNDATAASADTQTDQRLVRVHRLAVIVLEMLLETKTYTSLQALAFASLATLVEKAGDHLRVKEERIRTKSQARTEQGHEDTMQEQRAAAGIRRKIQKLIYKSRLTQATQLAASSKAPSIVDEARMAKIDEKLGGPPTNYKKMSAQETSEFHKEVDAMISIEMIRAAAKSLHRGASLGSTTLSAEVIQVLLHSSTSPLARDAFMRFFVSVLKGKIPMDAEKLWMTLGMTVFDKHNDDI
jgi:hypothetical protein